MPRALLGALVIGLCLGGPVRGLAAEHRTVEATPPAAELEAVVETLEDEVARARLIAELKALIAVERRLEAAEAPPAASNVVMTVLSERLDLLGRTASQLAVDSDDLARIGAWFTDQASLPERRGLWLRILWQMALSVVLGLPQAGYDVFIKLLGLLVAAMVLMLVLQNRGPVAEAIRVAADKRAGSNPAMRALRDRLGDVWHVLAALYILMIFGVWALQIPDGFAFLLRGTAVTVVAAAVARLVVYLVRQGVSRVFRVSAEIRVRYPALEERADRYLAIVRYALEAVVWLVALVVALEAWRLDVLSWLGAEAGRALAAATLDIVFVLAAAALVWEFANAAISRFLEATDEAGELIERGARTRTRTLLPLARKALLATIVTVSSLSVLSTLGVDIAPLLAGAGVVGLAIGFGAQTLVKDIITGAFILFEDILAVGNVATVGGHTGVVEEIGVRTIRLRDYSVRSTSSPSARWTR